jgi:hypothetical protein
VLVKFGRSFESLGPGDWNPERGPLEKNGWNAYRRRRHKLLANEHAIPVAEVTHRLMSGHLAPFALRGGRNRLRSADDLFLVTRIQESSHTAPVPGKRSCDRHRMRRTAKVRNYAAGSCWSRMAAIGATTSPAARTVRESAVAGACESETRRRARGRRRKRR